MSEEKQEVIEPKAIFDLFKRLQFWEQCHRVVGNVGARNDSYNNAFNLGIAAGLKKASDEICNLNIPLFNKFMMAAEQDEKASDD